MRKLWVSVCALFLAVAVSAQTADEILDKHIKATGGIEKQKALQSVKMIGKMKMGPMEVPFTMIKARPGQLRSDFTVQGMTGTQAFDGTTGWSVMPFLGKKDPEKMSDDMLASMRDEADFDGPLIDYKAKGHKIELLGKEDVQGSPAYKLHLTTKEGLESNLFIDAETYLMLKVASKRKVQGQEVEQESTMGDYKEVGGMMMPFSMEVKAKGAPAGQALVIEKYELNPKVDASMFKMPEVKKEEPKPEAKKQQ